MKWKLVTQSCLILQFHGLYPVPLLCPWNSPGKSTEVGCHFLLQGIFPTWESNTGLPHCRQILYQLNHKGSPWWSLGRSILLQMTFLFLSGQGSFKIVSIGWVQNAVIMSDWSVTLNESDAKHQALKNTIWCLTKSKSLPVWKLLDYL